MKKILASLLCVFALNAQAQAKENITIIYGFGPGDNSTNYSRNMANEANKMQNKYNFLFDVRPGAGQTIAVNYVKNTPNTIFMTSGAFWVRPNFYPNESYNVHDFKSLMTMCSVPFSIASVKYKSWNEVPKDRPTSIATSGLGVVSHLTALQIMKNYPQMILVPFKSTTEAVAATVGGQVDLVVGFLGDQEKWTSEDSKIKMSILGTTGPKPVGKYTNLSSQGFPAVLSKMNTPYVLMVPTTWSDDKVKEIRDILTKAETHSSVRKSYSLDYCQPFQVPGDKLQTWWNEQNATWSGLTVGVKLEN
jgi:tripartite-type tricarboxylate transporter receptor subunit TctC